MQLACPCGPPIAQGVDIRELRAISQPRHAFTSSLHSCRGRGTPLGTNQTETAVTLFTPISRGFESRCDNHSDVWRAKWGHEPQKEVLE